MLEQELKRIIDSGFDRGRKDSGFWSYEIEIFIIALKSLLPDLSRGGNRLDYKRFGKELELWKSYRHGGNTTIMSALRGDKTKYWCAEDESIPFRMLAIALANESVETIKEETLENIIYFTGDSEQLIQGLYIASFLGYLFNDESVEQLRDKAKEEMVKLSVKEDILDKGFLKLDEKFSKAKYVVEFERNRIELLNKLSGVDTERYPYVDILDSLILNDDTEIETKFGAFIEGKLQKKDGSEDRFAESIAKYIWKLRKGWISGEQIEIKQYVEPDVFSMAIGEEKHHSILNRIKLVSVEEQDGFEIRYVDSKTGRYRFFKRKNGR